MRRLPTGLLPIAALLALLAGAVARSWVSDDAFITFRVVDQLLAGNGPVYNAGERVQVFTHPLWFALLAATRALGLPFYGGTLALSLALFTAGLALLYAAFRDRPGTLAVVALAMACSRTIGDFATGGLETPLSFALFSAALWALQRRARLAVLLLSLLPLARLDLALLAAPFVVLASPPGWRERLRMLVLFAVPAAAWAAFSVLYYGSPVPNTAVAKLGGDALARLDTGVAYVVASLLTDPGALALVAFGAWSLARSGPFPGRGMVALAMALSGLYPVWTGGDFMLGRFLLPLLWASAAALLLAHRDLDATRRRAHAAGLLAMLAIAHLALGHAATNLWLRVASDDPLRHLAYAGVVDERRYYLPTLGAFSPARPREERRVAAAPFAMKVFDQLGVPGFREPLDQAVVDIFALTDPFLARIAPLPYGRPGHAYRPMPADFARWREPGHAFADPRLDALARDLRLAHRSPRLFSTERWGAIVRLLVARPVALEAAVVQDTGSEVRIRLSPRLLYRRAPLHGDAAPPGDYRTFLRVFDAEARMHERNVNLERPYPIGLDADCAVQRDPGFAVPSRDDEVLVVTCPRALVREGLLARVAAVRGAAIDFDVPFPLMRPPLRWWLASVPAWLADGWRTRPRPPIVIGLALLGLAAFVRRAR